MVFELLLVLIRPQQFGFIPLEQMVLGPSKWQLDPGNHIFLEVPVVLQSPIQQGPKAAFQWQH